MNTAPLLQAPVARPVEIATVDVAEIVERASDALAPLSLERRVRICQHYSGSCTVETDAAQLLMVIREFLADAIRSSEWEENILVRTVGRYGTVAVDIVTFGAGSQARAGRVLEAFLPRRPGQPVSAIAETRARLERLGGRLRTSTHLGRKTTFTIMIPRQHLRSAHAPDE